ncbi:MAG: hypothetical protein N2745_09445, partial [Syntrophorhabdaceae bacterium]|nr:hypothetical protein [Syntrophorhabdaceae bacterium]
MAKDFQIFVKPVGATCNLACRYCYYKGKVSMYKNCPPPLIGDGILKRYIIKHIEATEGDLIRFSWHGGEPMLAGIDFFKKVVSYQKRYKPPKKKIQNGI